MMKIKNEITFNSFWLRILFAFSATAFTGLELNDYTALNSRFTAGISLFLVFGLAFYLTGKYNLLYRFFMFCKLRYLWFSIPITLYAMTEILAIYNLPDVSRYRGATGTYQVYLIVKYLLWLLSPDRNTVFSESAGSSFWYLFLTVTACVAYPFVFSFIYAIISRLPKWAKSCLQEIRKAEQIERRYVIITVIIFSALLIFTYNQTEVMYYEKSGEEATYDIIFTADSPLYYASDTWFQINAPENDIRQPFYGLITMPFALLAKIASMPLFFLPNAYLLILQLLQSVLLPIIAVLLTRMLALKNNFSKIMFLIVYSISYPILFFSFVVEQYVPAVFLLLIVLYRTYFKKKQNVGLLVLSTGAILTNAILIPFATFSKKWQDWLHSLGKFILFFLGIWAFCGKIPQMFNFIERLKFLLTTFTTISSGDDSAIIYNKFWQFTNFIANCFYAPGLNIRPNALGCSSFQLPVPTENNLLGMILFLLAILSIILNRKILFAKICGLWVLFSVIILYAIGYGSPENGMILYSLYFGWPFVALIFLLVEKLSAKWETVKYLVYPPAILFMAFFNIRGMGELIKFCIQYYPI